MNEKVQFWNMFALYQPPEQEAALFAQAAVRAAQIDPVKRTVMVEMEAPGYIPERIIQSVSRQIEAHYGLERLEIYQYFPESELAKLEPGELTTMFVAEDSICRGTLAGAKYEWEGTDLTIRLRANGKDTLEACIPAVQQRLNAMFATQVSVSVVSGKDLQGQALYDAMEKIRSEAVIHQAKPVFVEKKTAPAASAGGSADTIYGKPFRATPVPMKDIKLDMGIVTVEGKVFSVEHRELKKRNAWVVNFDMTDDTNSIRINRFMEANEAKPILEQVSVGTVLKVQGKLVINQFDNEMVLKPYAIMAGHMEKRRDTAEGMKRVELHLHTTMSNMDALTPTAAAVKQAAAWGHRAIAITDHGVVQSFPDAMKAASKAKVAGTDQNIKILYGVEGYFVNDVDDRIVVHGQQDHPLDGEFVAFDLETTGLSSREDTIIEIGAVRMKGGQELARFQTFVDPGRSLERKIVDLTGITDDMLVGAPKIEEVLPQFLEFVGDSPLIAHNADFDTGFIREAAKRQGLEFTSTSVDTLILSQNLLPQLNKFKLNIVAEALDLPEFNHHRAADDAVTCGLVFWNLVPRLDEMGIRSLAQINPAMPQLRSKSRIDNRHARHIILFAKNQVGLRNLYHLISDSNLTYFKRVPRIPKSELLELREGLIIGSACEAGELYQAIMEHKSEDELRRIASFYDFLEVQPLCNNAFMLAKGLVKDVEEIREFNRTVIRLGEALDIPVVATGDVHFLTPEDEVFRHILLATKGFDDCDRSNPLYFRTTDEMLQEFSYLGEEKAYEIVVKNTNYIADQCETLRPVPHNLFAPKIENSVEDLKNLVYGKFHRLYGDNPPELMVKRVETELNDIINCHYDVIYMSAQKLVQNSLEHGYLVGSRGSVGSSIVAYMSGITEVNSFPPHYRCPNPECKYTTFDVPKGYGCGADLPDAICPKCGTKFEKDGFNIPFETFLGFGGDKVPDIDLNFSGVYQPRAHAYIEELFGKQYCYRAGTIGTLADKTAYGYVKKYCEERELTLSEAEMNRLALGCVGVKRTTGQHPAGMVVLPKEYEIQQFVAIQHPANDMSNPVVTTHYDFGSMHDVLVKLDVLGHDDPTMIRMLMDLTSVDAQKIPLTDPKVISLFSSTEALGVTPEQIGSNTGTYGVPEFGTKFVRQMLEETKPTTMDELIRISGLSHGTDVWIGNAQEIVKNGIAPFSSCICTRDDIMNALMDYGVEPKMAFDTMEFVRKGKGLKPEMEQAMIDHSVPQWFIDSCKKIKYMFPKGHAVAYVTMSLRVAWYKVYRPAAYYCAYYTVRADGFDASILCGSLESIRARYKEMEENSKDLSQKDKDLMIIMELVIEMLCRGIHLAPVDLEKSDATKFQVLSDTLIRVPFNALPGLGEAAAQAIVEAREQSPFISVEDLRNRGKASQAIIDMMRELGCLNNLPETNQTTLFSF